MIIPRTARVLSRSILTIMSPTAIALAAWLVGSSATVHSLRAQDTTKAASTRIDFQDADLRAVITALAEAGGLNVTYGEILNRRVTLHLPQGLSKADMLPLLRSVASSNGLRVVADGSLLRVESVDTREAASATTRATKEGVQLFVYRLKHARAPRLASTLQSIYGGRSAAESQGNSFGLSGRPLSEQLRSTQIPPLNMDTLGRGALVVPGATVLAGTVQGEIQIVPDETTNSLLIRAQPADYEVIRQAVDVLDLRPLQVFIEVLIAEVRRTRSLDLGITAGATRTENGNETTGSITSSAANDFLVHFTRGGAVSVDVALSALSTRGDVHILSRPLILAENNLEARILVGSQRPFVQVFRSLPTDGAVRDQVVQYRDVGTSLSLLPTINPDGYVNLQVKQEVSSATNELQFGAPVISTREASTHLFVKDGETVVIGGLADRQVEQTRSGIPILSSIPWIGGLFGATRNTDAQNELYLFLTPHIVTSDDDASQLRRSIEGRLDAVGGKREDNPQVTPTVSAPVPKTPTTPSAKP
jgi:type II secretory pathway component GspD/PulD (secretin)